MLSYPFRLQLATRAAMASSSEEVAVFTDTNLSTHIAMAVSPDITAGEFKSKWNIFYLQSSHFLQFCPDFLLWFLLFFLVLLVFGFKTCSFWDFFIWVVLILSFCYQHCLFLVGIYRVDYLFVGWLLIFVLKICSSPENIVRVDHLFFIWCLLFYDYESFTLLGEGGFGKKLV